MNAIGYLNPFSEGFRLAGDKYNDLGPWQKTASVIAGIVGGVLTPFIICLGSAAVFRWTVEKFTDINNSTSKSTSKIDGLVGKSESDQVEQGEVRPGPIELTEQYISQKLLPGLRGSTADENTECRYGDLKEGETYTFFNEAKILDREGFIKEDEYTAGSFSQMKVEIPERMLLLTFDHNCYFQGGAIGGVADFKMGVFQHVLEEEKVPFHWIWRNDESLRVIFPIETDQTSKIASLLDHMVSKSFFSEHVLNNLIENKSMSLSHWGLSSASREVKLSLTNDGEDLKIHIPTEFYRKTILKAFKLDLKKYDISAAGESIILKKIK